MIVAVVVSILTVNAILRLAELEGGEYHFASGVVTLGIITLLSMGLDLAWAKF